MSESANRVVIGVDTGGTFTDATLLDPATGRVWTAKTPSTPADPSLGFADSVAKVLEISGFKSDAVGRVLHATTVATNLILEEKGPTTGMLVNDGFRYVIEIGRQGSPRGISPLKWLKPRRLIKPQNIFEVRGRMDQTGAELEPLDEEAIRAAARRLRDSGISAISVVFLHSYVNPAHEQRARALLLEEFPEALISLSSDVVPVFREYERSMTTNLNAYVMRAIVTYVARIEMRLKERGITAPLMLMKSSGGVASSRSICARPVETALSGPAAGVVGVGFIGSGVGVPNLISVDIGGTSADISVIVGGSAMLGATGRVGEWPISLPMVEVTTIGAGGGSIATVSAAGAMSVGPHSAGAMPGPVCYGRGGTLPTVTDAHLVLGHLPPHLLNGAFALDKEAARAAIQRHVAEPLGLSVEAAAEGILQIADNNMVGTIRKLSVERGLDPREFALVPFGGAGPLHGGSLARLLGIRKSLLVPSPGVLSAFGLLVSSLKAEFAQTCLQRSGQWNMSALVQTVDMLKAQAAAWFKTELVPQQAQRVQLIVSMRYEHQGFELSVPWSGQTVDEACLASTIDAFHVLHERLYTYAQRDTPVELINIRVDAMGTFEQPRLTEPPRSSAGTDATVGSTTAYVEGQWRPVPIYAREKLGTGMNVEGPAIITQLDTTTWLLPGQFAEVTTLGAILIHDERV